MSLALSIAALLALGIGVAHSGRHLAWIVFGTIAALSVLGAR